MSEEKASSGDIRTRRPSRRRTGGPDLDPGADDPSVHRRRQQRSEEEAQPASRPGGDEQLTMMKGADCSERTVRTSNHEESPPQKVAKAAGHSPPWSEKDDAYPYDHPATRPGAEAVPGPAAVQGDDTMKQGYASANAWHTSDQEEEKEEIQSPDFAKMEAATDDYYDRMENDMETTRCPAVTAENQDQVHPGPMRWDSYEGIPGAHAIQGLDAPDNDDGTVQIGDQPVTARIVEHDDDSVREQLQRVLEERRSLAVAEVVDTKKRQRRLIAACVFLSVLVIVGIVLGVTLPERPSGSVNATTDELISLLSGASSDGGVALGTLLTPQNRAFNWLAGDAKLLDYSDKTILQRYTLATLYYGTNGGNWTRQDRWLDYSDECTWSDTLTCTADGDVSAIELISTNLTGIVPPEIGLLSGSLDTLALPGNRLDGDIPTETGQLTGLTELILSRNNIDGTIPLTFGQLTSLKTLNLHDNKLEYRFPPEIGALTSLTKLDLSENKLSGTVPTDVGGLTNLVQLYLWGNLLTGATPTEIMQLTNLNELVIFGNQFGGVIPPQIGALTNLVKFDAGENVLSGFIPTEIGQLTNLVYLYLDNNRLRGAIPSEIASLTNLENIRLYNNMLTGAFSCPEFIDTCYVSCALDPVCRAQEA